MAELPERVHDEPSHDEAPPSGVGEHAERHRAGILKKAVRGAFWTIATSLGSRVLGVAGTLAVTRFLSPEDYGQFSIGAVVIQTAGTLSNCGLSQYIVSKPDAGRKATFHATFYFLMLGALSIAVAVLLAGRIGAAFDAPRLVSYLPGLAVAALLERFCTIQDRIQLRDMRFRSVGVQRSLGEIVFTVSSVSLAAAGFGASALVWGSLLRSTVRLVTLTATTQWRDWIEPHVITKAHSLDLFRFGLPMAIAEIAAVGSRKWDNLVFARYFGAGQQGFYNLAYNLADIPATQLGETLGDVLVPSFAKMKTAEEQRSALLLSMRMLMLLIAPLAIGLGAVSASIVHAIFDPRWESIRHYLTILAVLSVVRPIGWIGSSYLQVRNRPRTIMVLEISKTVMLVGLMAAIATATRGSEHGPLWTCAAVGIAFGINALGYMWVFKKLDGLSFSKQILPLLPPIIACVPMVIAIYYARWLFTLVLHMPKGIESAAEILVGAIVFIPSALVIAPGLSRELVALVKSARQRRRAAAPEAAPEAPAP